ncbi:hypothetical protein RIVM261_088840 [Rivularia sp. IAM M-261]|nr:hypothetical protein RIVM261_088840 [Rivularia sp. IAM M-261]
MISENQLKQCITEIGLLGLSTSIILTEKLRLHEGCKTEYVGLQWLPSARILGTATALLDLAKVVKNNWNAIEKRPLKTIKTEIASVDIKRATCSTYALIQAKLNPYKRQTLGVSRVESHECNENEFLCYVLDVYLRDLGNGIANVLNSLTIEDILLPPIPPKFQQERPHFMAALVERVQKRNILIDDERKKISETVAQLKACAEWASQVRKAKFLENIVTPDEPPYASLRLRGSLTYGSIFEQYLNCRADTMAAIEKVVYLYKCTYQGQLLPRWEIYKIWCIVRLYSTFILYTNMLPPVGEATMFERIRIKRGIIELPKNQDFKLIGYLDNGQSFSIKFCLEPELISNANKITTPDIKLKIITQNQEMQYCFNIKDRNYGKEGYTHFIEDVIKEARNIYLNNFNMKASFVIHTDNKLDYWGKVDIKRFLTERFNVNIEANEYVEHKYGAISLLPGKNADRQFQKIIQLLLKYHNDFFKTACLACGHQLKQDQEEIRPSWIPSLISESELIDRVLHGSNRAGSATGVYCSCSQCGDFWVVQLCYGNHHPLLKLRNCFHRNSDHSEFFGRWMYICPVCGSDPSLDEILATRNAAF